MQHMLALQVAFVLQLGRLGVALFMPAGKCEVRPRLQAALVAQRAVRRQQHQVRGRVAPQHLAVAQLAFCASCSCAFVQVALRSGAACGLHLGVCQLQALRPRCLPIRPVSPAFKRGTKGVFCMGLYNHLY